MAKVIAYTLVKATTPDELQNAVNAVIYVNSGWEPLGGVMFSDRAQFLYMQAMVQKVQG